MLNLLLKAEKSLAARLVQWQRRQQALAELNALDDRSLADIGLTRSDIPHVLTQARPVQGSFETAVPAGSLKHAA